MAKYKKQRKKFDQINVIPFIDIMLVLLVMVLTTTTFIKQGVMQVELPKASASTKKDVSKEVNIYIKQDGKLFYEKEALSLQELKQKLSKLSKKDTVVLRSDKNSQFQDFVSVMNILKELQHEQLYIVTKE